MWQLTASMNHKETFYIYYTHIGTGLRPFWCGILIMRWFMLGVFFKERGMAKQGLRLWQDLLHLAESKISANVPYFYLFLVGTCFVPTHIHQQGIHSIFLLIINAFKSGQASPCFFVVSKSWGSVIAWGSVIDWLNYLVCEWFIACQCLEISSLVTT